MVKIISKEPLQLIINNNDIDDRLDVPFYDPKYTKIVEKINRKVAEDDQPRIGQLAKLSRITGFARTKHVKYIKSKEIPFLRVQNVEELGINLDFVKYISFEAHNELKDSQLKGKDLIMTTTGSVGITTVIPNGMECNATQEVIRIRLSKKWNKKEINPYYVALFCNSNYFRLMLDRWNSGSSRPRTLIKNIRKIKIPLLSEKEMNELGKSYKTCIENRKKSIDVFDQVRNIFKYDMGLNFDSVKRSKFYIINKKDLINTVINEKLIENRIDAKYYNPFYYKIMDIIKKVSTKEMFRVAKLSDIVDYSSIPLPKIIEKKKYRYIRILNLNRYLGIIQDFQEYTAEDMPNRASLTLEEGDIITANSGSKTGTKKHRTAIVTKFYSGSIGSSAFATLKPRNKKYSALIYASLRTYIGLYQIRRLLRGSSTPYLSTDSEKIDDLGNIKIIIPPDKILNRINDLVNTYNLEMNKVYSEFENVKEELINNFN